MIKELNGDFLQWLRGFYYVAKTGSVRRAAEIMHRNPSTISYQLRSLEEELGTALFDRNKKNLQITPDGDTILEWAISTFETLQNLISSVGNLGGVLQGSVRMAATLPVATVAVSPISRFVRENPKVELYLERHLSGEVRKAVESSAVDFVLLPIISGGGEDELEIIAKSRPLLVLNRDNPWGVPPIPTAQDLSGLPYVAFSSREGRDDLGEYVVSSGMEDFIQKNAVIRVNNYHLMMRFVWQKLGVAIMDEMCFYGTYFGANWQNLQSIPLDHILPNQLYGLMTRRHKYITPQARALMDVLRLHFLSFSPDGAGNLWDSARQNVSADGEIQNGDAGLGRKKPGGKRPCGRQSTRKEEKEN